MSQNENMYVEETDEQRMRRNKKEEEACLQMLIEANIENDLLIEARAAARARAAMEEVERQKQLHELRERERRRFGEATEEKIIGSWGEARVVGSQRTGKKKKKS